MDPAGMVHALEKIHACLAPGGFLIDIHPAGEMPPIFVRSETGQSLIGWMGETDYFAEYLQADAAVAQVAVGGLFRIAKHLEFFFEAQAEDMAGLRAYLQGSWSDALLEAGLEGRAEKMQHRTPGPSNVILAERVEIYKLVPKRPLNFG